MRLRGFFTCYVNSLHSPPSEPSAYKGAYTGYVSAQPRLRTEKYAPIGIHRPVARLCNPSPSSERKVESIPTPTFARSALPSFVEKGDRRRGGGG